MSFLFNDNDPSLENNDSDQRMTISKQLIYMPLITMLVVLFLYLFISGVSRVTVNSSLPAQAVSPR